MNNGLIYFLLVFGGSILGYAFATILYHYAFLHGYMRFNYETGNFEKVKT